MLWRSRLSPKTSNKLKAQDLIDFKVMGFCPEILSDLNYGVSCMGLSTCKQVGSKDGISVVVQVPGLDAVHFSVRNQSWSITLPDIVFATDLIQPFRYQCCHVIKHMVGLIVGWCPAVTAVTLPFGIKYIHWPKTKAFINNINIATICLVCLVFIDAPLHGINIYKSNTAFILAENCKIPT